MKRCTYCRGRIWPWERRGWHFAPTGVRYWHSRCRYSFLVIDRLLDRAERWIGR